MRGTALWPCLAAGWGGNSGTKGLHSRARTHRCGPGCVLSRVFWQPPLRDSEHESEKPKHPAFKDSRVNNSSRRIPLSHPPSSDGGNVDTRRFNETSFALSGLLFIIFWAMAIPFNAIFGATAALHPLAFDTFSNHPLHRCDCRPPWNGKLAQHTRAQNWLVALGYHG